MLRRPHYIASGLIVVLTLIMLNLPGQTTARLKSAVSSVFLPLLGLTGSSQRLAERAGDSLASRSQLVHENEVLQHQNEELRIRLNQLDQIQRENDRLRQLLGWQQQKRWPLKLARVTLHDPSNFWRTLQIDLGSRDG